MASLVVSGGKDELFKHSDLGSPVPDHVICRRECAASHVIILTSG